MMGSSYALQELANVEIGNTPTAKYYTTVPSPANNDNKVPAKVDHAPLLPEDSPRAFNWCGLRRGRGEGFPRMVGLWILCVILLVLHIFAVLKWPTGDYGIRVLRENMDCGSNGTGFMTFIISLPLNGLATILCLPSGSLGPSKSKLCIVLRVIMILTTIPTHLM
jgi:hypothetical protein